MEGFVWSLSFSKSFFTLLTIKSMLSAAFPFVYAFVLLLLLWQAIRVISKGYFASNAFERSNSNLKKDRTGKFTIHPELLDEEGKITDEDLLTVRFSSDFDPPKQTESSSEENM